MCVLHIEDRVVLRLLEHLVEIEIQRSIVLARQHDEAGDVPPDLVDDVAIIEEARGLAKQMLEADPAVREAFERIRGDILARGRDHAQLRDDVASMRQRMRDELDRSDEALFDLKQGQGGLVDLEFLLQYLVLRDASSQPDLLLPRATRPLLEALAASGVLPEDVAATLRKAHAWLVAAGLDCTLDRRPRLVPHDPALDAARAAIGEAWRGHGPGA